MNLNSPNQWDNTPVQHKPKGLVEKLIALGAKFLALPRGVQGALIIVAFLVVAGLAGTLLGWAFSLLAFVGRILIIGLVLAFVLSLFRKKK